MNNNNSKFGSLAIVSTTGYFAEYREACAHHLSKLGWEVTLQENFKGTKSFDGILVIGISFYRYIPFIPGQFRIGINSEQMPLQGDSDWSLLRNRKRFDAISSQYDLVIEWSPSSYLHTPCHTAYSYLPYGSPVPSGKEKTEKWDVVFLGSPFGSENRRGKLLATLKKNCNLCPLHYAWEEKKYDLINSAKICLNLHQFSTRSFESPRLFELLAEGIFVMSEQIENSFPFQAGRDYIAFSDEKDMIEKVDYYLKHPDERNSIAASGHYTVQSYSQERQFGLLSIELLRCRCNHVRFVFRYIYWLRGCFMNLYIDSIDLLAKIYKNAGKTVSRSDRGTEKQSGC